MPIRLPTYTEGKRERDEINEIGEWKLIRKREMINSSEWDMIFLAEIINVKTSEWCNERSDINPETEFKNEGRSIWNVL